MEHEQIVEFEFVRNLAHNALRLGSSLDVAGSRVCQLRKLPSFENSVSWDLIKANSRGSGTQMRLYRSCWRMDVDCKAMSSPNERLKHFRSYNPTIESKWVPVNEEEVKSILARFHAIRIPLLMTSKQIGCDGTSYEMAVGDFFCNARIGWWCDLPEEWRELRLVLTDLERLIETTWEHDSRTHQ